MYSPAHDTCNVPHDAVFENSLKSPTFDEVNLRDLNRCGVCSVRMLVLNDGQFTEDAVFREHGNGLFPAVEGIFRYLHLTSLDEIDSLLGILPFLKDRFPFHVTFDCALLCEYKLDIAYIAEQGPSLSLHLSIMVPSRGQ